MQHTREEKWQVMYGDKDFVRFLNRSIIQPGISQLSKSIGSVADGIFAGG